ncbi:MAG: hypothetical protein R3C28_18475 [Pirellulaceae bacterium]
MPNECSLSKFWEALVASKLIDAERSNELQDHFSRLPGSEHANASVAAEWLLEQNVVTRYQAHLLLAGKQGPFVFGPYRILDKAVSSVFSKRFHAIHLPTQHPVILHFWSGAVDDQQVQRSVRK